MPAPSKLSIATSSVLRLLNEESSYHKELSQQEAHVQKLEQGGGAGDENDEFVLKQERKAVEETKAIFPPLRERITAASTKLEQLMAEGELAGSEEERAKAQDALAQATNLWL